jgi:hypothetical protein
MRKLMMELISSVVVCAVMALPCMAQESSGPVPTVVDEHAGGVKSLEKRVLQLEEALGRKVTGDKWYDRFQLSGVVEIEAAYNTIDYKDPASADEESSDVDLATVELGVDVKVVEQVDAHVLFKWEDDELFVDEGFVTVVGTEAFPAYMIAGRQYIPFGNFDSHFISDPTTLTLGETNAGALVGGYRFNGEMVDLSVGAFNGRTKEINADDHIANVVAAVVVSWQENLLFGASYTSNLAAADTTAEFITDVDGDGENNNIAGFVGGWSAFATVTFLERGKLIGEYVAAIENFKAGELYDAGDTHKRKPRAWNVELGWAINDTVEIAARYEGSDDGGDAASGVFLMPEAGYGAVVNWSLFDHTNLALEYLHADFEGDIQTTDTVTIQLAAEF